MSSVGRRRVVAVLAAVGAVVAIALALDQLGRIRVWEPFFGSGSEAVLHSSLSRRLPVPDAALGAAAYAVEAVTALIGGEERWRTHPGVVLLYGATALGLGAVAMVLVALQAFAIGAFCTLCLASAAISLAIVGPAASELRHAIAERRRRRRPAGLRSSS